MIQNCHDFLNEMSQLEFVCQQLGSKAVIATKCHAEFPGEGNEDLWGFYKSSQVTSVDQKGQGDLRQTC
jgi:hypothetical protein